MKKEQDGFILFDPTEFANWLSSQVINRKIIRIQNHHTWKPDYSNFKGNNHIALLAAMKNYHVNHNGWSDIAQNLTTFPDGTIAVCRPLNSTPVGIKGANTGGICIEHLGNFDLDKDKMSPEHKDTIIKLNALLCYKFCLAPNKNSIVYHHWYDLNSGIRRNGEGATKTCPGTNFFGGNKVEDAEHNFIPLILEKHKELESKISFNSYGQVTASKLNLRDGPSSNNNVIGSLSNGTIVRIYKELNGWSKIDTDEQWVSSEYLSILDKGIEVAP